MFIIIVTIVITILVFKLMNKTEVQKLKKEIEFLQLQIIAFKKICAKYEEHFGLEESLKILKEIENQP